MIKEIYLKRLVCKLETYTTVLQNLCWVTYCRNASANVHPLLTFCLSTSIAPWILKMNKKDSWREKNKWNSKVMDKFNIPHSDPPSWTLLARARRVPRRYKLTSVNWATCAFQAYFYSGYTPPEFLPHYLRCINYEQRIPYFLMNKSTLYDQIFIQKIAPWQYGESCLIPRLQMMNTVNKMLPHVGSKKINHQQNVWNMSKIKCKAGRLVKVAGLVRALAHVGSLTN